MGPSALTKHVEFVPRVMGDHGKVVIREGYDLVTFRRSNVIARWKIDSGLEEAIQAKGKAKRWVGGY